MLVSILIKYQGCWGAGGLYQRIKMLVFSEVEAGLPGVSMFLKIWSEFPIVKFYNESIYEFSTINMP